jgi:hypothetical protein
VCVCLSVCLSVCVCLSLSLSLSLSLTSVHDPVGYVQRNWVASLGFETCQPLFVPERKSRKKKVGLAGIELGSSGFLTVVPTHWTIVSVRNTGLQHDCLVGAVPPVTQLTTARYPSPVSRKRTWHSVFSTGREESGGPCLIP